MANTTRQLTNTEVSQSKPKNKEYYLADGKGLQLRVRPNGTKQWLFKYFKPYTKKRTNISLGQYPATSLSKAREVTLDYRKLLAEGIDPKDHRREQENRGRDARENTLEVVYRKWLKTKEDAWSDSYQKRLTQALELHILPALGQLPISKINAPDTIKLLEPIADRQAFETIRKLCRWINEIMIFATNTGLVDANRLAGIAKAFKPPQVVNQPSIKPKQLPKFLKALEKSGNTITTKCLILWLLHTMARPGEGAGAKWDEINFKDKVWKLDPERMKKRRPHTVPLTVQTLQILEAMKPISRHREYIFPSRSRPREPINSETPNVAMKRMGYKGIFTAHGMRALASTVLNEQEFPEDIIEVSQSRVGKDAVRAVYNRAEYLKQRRIMMAWWSSYIEAAATGEPIMTDLVRHLKAV
jgi:integrase